MTLSTHVFIQAQTDPLAVFAKCNELLAAGDGIRFEDEQSKYRPEGVRTRRNLAGQGLNALLYMHYGTDAPIRADGDSCSEDCEPDEDYHHHDPMHWIDVDFDTGYSYTGPEGGCGALHARLVFELGTWLDDQGIPWCWENEFDGAIYGGEDRYRKLTELVGSGQAAARWLKSVVIPGVEAMAARGEL